MKSGIAFSFVAIEINSPHFTILPMASFIAATRRADTAFIPFCRLLFAYNLYLCRNRRAAAI